MSEVTRLFAEVHNRNASPFWSQFFYRKI